MTNTNILCPECFMGRIFTEDNKIGNCNKCGTKFSILGKNRVKYYTSKETKQSIKMISEKYKLKRGLTMGEFYGTSTID